jgi:hypothetical protein
MLNNKRCAGFSKFAMIASVLIAWFAVPYGTAQGDNAVWSATTKVPSSAFIDASVATGTDLCAKIFNSIALLPASGGVVDARGVNSGTSQTCTSGTPWVQGTSGANRPSIVLLPSGTVTTSRTWILPNGTKILGQGAGAHGDSVTTLQAASGFAGVLIQMGPNSNNSPLTACPANTGCTDVGVEDLALQGNASAANSGIVNGQSQDMSYVRRVSMYQLGGIGLKLQIGGATASAKNSGPYSQITFDAGAAGSTNTICAQILATATVNLPTRGLHGISCSSNATSSVGIQLDSSNNSIEDVHIQGFSDGIVIGSTANVSATSNVLLNVNGNSDVNNLIHLEDVGTVADIGIVGINANGSAVSLEDDVSASPSLKLSDAYIAMYMLGESTPISSSFNAYSRFTTSTSPSIVTWASGSTSPAGSTCANKGSFFSYAPTSGSGDLFLCTGSWISF